MTDPIDYSRPVGWWCPVCHMQWAAYPNTLIRQHQHAIIPHFLPIPEGQRPLVEDEVESAEVCTGSLRDDSLCCLVTNDAVYAPDNGWQASIIHLAEYAGASHINDVAQASARARIVTGATE